MRNRNKPPIFYALHCSFVSYSYLSESSSRSSLILIDTVAAAAAAAEHPLLHFFFAAPHLNSFSLSTGKERKKETFSFLPSFFLQPPPVFFVGLNKIYTALVLQTLLRSTISWCFHVAVRTLREKEGEEINQRH